MQDTDHSPINDLIADTRSCNPNTSFEAYTEEIIKGWTRYFD